MSPEQRSETCEACDGLGWIDAGHGHNVIPHETLGCPDCGGTGKRAKDLMAALEASLSDVRAGQRWEQIKAGASLSVLPNAPVVIARIVWDGEPLTGSGATSDAALTDLRRQIEETCS